MKRAGHLWESFCSVETAEEAIFRGTMNKRTDRVVVRMFGYAKNSPEHPRGSLDPKKVHAYAVRLVNELGTGRWNHQPGRTRHIVSNGKDREIEIARLKDHLVQWMAMLTIEKLETKKMYRHSCGNLPGRGIEDARKTVERWVRSGDCRFFVKLDIRHFYQTVNLRLLSDLLRRHIKDERFMRMMDQIVYSSAQQETLFEEPHNLAIGYYSSPWFANIYLTPLDNYITGMLYKERRGKRISFVKHYLRYVDDLLLMGTSKSDLKKAVKKIAAFCRDQLHVEIKDCWEICEIGESMPADEQKKMRLKPGTKKVDIVGYTFTTTVTTVRARNFLRLRRLARKIRKRLDRHLRVSLRSAQAFVSRLGWFGHADSKHFLALYILPFIHPKFMREVLSYASKNGIVGAAACIRCQQGKTEGSYHILHRRRSA